MIKLKLIDVLRDRLATLLSHSHDVRIYVLSSTVRELEKVGTVHPTNETIQTALRWCRRRCPSTTSTTTNDAGDGSDGSNCTILSNDDDDDKNNNNDNTSMGAGGDSGATARAPPVSNDDGDGSGGVAMTKGKGGGKGQPAAAAEHVVVVVPPETVAGLSDAARKLFHYVAAHPRFFVASQDEDLLSSLRQNRHLPVPIIRLSRAVLLLERPNFHHQHHHDKTTTGSGGSCSSTAPVKGSALTASERELVDMIKRQERDQRPSNHGSGGVMATAQRGRTSKKAKGPNPLSCKPSTKNNKRKAVVNASSSDAGHNNNNNNKKRTRRKRSTTTSSLAPTTTTTDDATK